MAYNYETEKEKIFTDKGQRVFLSLRDHALDLVKKAGAVRMDQILNKEPGESWFKMACVDRMVELGDLVEVKQGDCAGQHRIFTRYQ